MPALHPIIEEIQALLNEAPKMGRHIVVRVRTVNGRQVRQRKIKCGPGWKWTGKRCEKITGAEKIKKVKATRKRLRKLRSKGSSWKFKAQRKRKKSVRRGKAMGIYKHANMSNSKKATSHKKPKPPKPHKRPKPPKPKKFKLKPYKPPKPFKPHRPKRR